MDHYAISKNPIGFSIEMTRMGQLPFNKTGEGSSSSSAPRRTITIDHCGRYSAFLAELFFILLEKAIPGVVLEKHQLEDRRIFQIHEFGRRFYSVYHLTDIPDSEMARIVDDVVACRYLDAAVEISGGRRTRTITIDHCGYASASRADKFVKRLKATIPGIEVVKNYVEDEKILQIREGARKFFRADHLADISRYQMAKIVDDVAARRYIPDDAHSSDIRTITIDHCGFRTGFYAKKFVELLERAIPGVYVETNYLKNRWILQIREGERKFYYLERPYVRWIEMTENQEADIVANVVARRYLRD